MAALNISLLIYHITLSLIDFDWTTLVKLSLENEKPFPLLFLGAYGIPEDNPQ